MNEIAMTEPKPVCILYRAGGIYESAATTLADTHYLSVDPVEFYAPLFVVMEIGCLECKIPTKVVALLNDESEAMQLCDRLEDIHPYSDISYQYFELPKLNVIALEFEEMLND